MLSRFRFPRHYRSSPNSRQRIRTALTLAPCGREGGGETRVSWSMLRARRTASRCSGMRALQGRGGLSVSAICVLYYGTLNNDPSRQPTGICAVRCEDSYRMISCAFSAGAEIAGISIARTSVPSTTGTVGGITRSPAASPSRICVRPVPRSPSLSGRRTAWPS